jgi:hypothetical protein
MNFLKAALKKFRAAPYRPNAGALPLGHPARPFRPDVDASAIPERDLSSSFENFGPQARLHAISAAGRLLRDLGHRSPYNHRGRHDRLLQASEPRAVSP